MDVEPDLHLIAPEARHARVAGNGLEMSEGHLDRRTLLAALPRIDR